MSFALGEDFCVPILSDLIEEARNRVPKVEEPCFPALRHVGKALNLAS